jgi:hypothetical protein
MLGHKRMLLKAFGMAANVQALSAITITLAGTKIVTKAYRFALTVGRDTAP